MSDFLDHKLMMHERACMITPCSEFAPDNRLTLLVGAKNYQASFHWPFSLSVAAQAQQLNVLPDPNFDTWNSFNRPVL